MAQITNRGYILKTQNQYYAEQVQLYRDIDVMWNLDPSTPDGLKIAHDAEVFGALDEQLLRAYLSKDPASATGVDLDIISALTDTYRDSGSRSTVTLKLTGVPGTIIDRGKRVSSKTTGQRWVLSQGYVLDENGEAFVEAYSERVGMIEADAHTLTQIVDSVGGWTGVTNPNIATPGRNIESDAELRIKRLQQVAKLGESQIDSMKGEIYDVKDVRRVEIYENDTSEVDDIGLPAHSTCVLVDGGAIDEIATAIYMKRNPGTLQFLAPDCEHHTVDVTSPRYPLSRAQPIKFNRPKYIDIEMVVEVVNDGSLPSNANDLIEQAILEFTNGELIPDDVGFKRAGFDIGENVPISTMMTPVNKIIGQYGNSYIKSLTLNGVSTGVLEISPFELTRWVSSNIEVIVE